MNALSPPPLTLKYIARRTVVCVCPFEVRGRNIETVEIKQFPSEKIQRQTYVHVTKLYTLLTYAYEHHDKSIHHRYCNAIVLIFKQFYVKK